jgi:cysteine-S-conjugate beta-lyase
VTADFDFDAPVTRNGSDSTKWARYGDRDVLPMWVADMDFAAPPAVVAALQERIAHGVFGYNQPTPAQTQAVIDYLDREFSYPVEAEWIVWLPGLVTGLNVASRAVGEAGDAVFSATPVYPPFLTAPMNFARRTVTAPLVRVDGAWTWNFAAVDAVLATSGARLFELCHPHNPVGRVWNVDELWQIAALAEKYDLVVCSDEIHNGLILDPDCRHRVFASLAPEVARRTITLMAPSKTFNIPGLGAAFALINDAGLRRRFRDAMQGIVPHVNVLGMAATEAALTRCADWHAALIAYLRGNARQVERAVEATPGLAMTTVEATYLAWIDVSDLGLTDPVRHFEAHGLGLSDGADFGAPGFVRLNFGTRRALLDEALARLAAAVKAIPGSG